MGEPDILVDESEKKRHGESIDLRIDEVIDINQGQAGVKLLKVSQSLRSSDRCIL